MTKILTDDVINKIVSIADEGIQKRFIAERFGVSRSTISNALKIHRERQERERND